MGLIIAFKSTIKRVWDQFVHAFQEVCDYAPDLQISIEYKPYKEGSYAFIDSMGVTGMMLNDIDRDNIGVTLDYFKC